MSVGARLWARRGRWRAIAGPRRSQERISARLARVSAVGVPLRRFAHTRAIARPSARWSRARRRADARDVATMSESTRALDPRRAGAFVVGGGGVASSRPGAAAIAVAQLSPRAEALRRRRAGLGGADAAARAAAGADGLAASAAHAGRAFGALSRATRCSATSTPATSPPAAALLAASSCSASSTSRGAASAERVNLACLRGFLDDLERMEAADGRGARGVAGGRRAVGGGGPGGGARGENRAREGVEGGARSDGRLGVFSAARAGRGRRRYAAAQFFRMRAISRVSPTTSHRRRARARAPLAAAQVRDAHGARFDPQRHARARHAGTDGEAADGPTARCRRRRRRRPSTSALGRSR